MELAIFVVANLVLLLLLVLAVRLIRSGGRSGNVVVDDVDASRSVHPVTPTSGVAVGEPTSPTVTVPVTVTVPAPVIVTAPAPVPPRVASLRSTPTAASSSDRPGSRITVVSSFGGDGPSRADLVLGVIHALRDIGLRPAPPVGDSGRLVDAHGRVARVRAGRCSDGSDHIEVSLDSALAVEALATLELWHRNEWARSDRLHVTARIR